MPHFQAARFHKRARLESRRTGSSLYFNCNHAGDDRCTAASCHITSPIAPRTPKRIACERAFSRGRLPSFVPITSARNCCRLPVAPKTWVSTRLVAPAFLTPTLCPFVPGFVQTCLDPAATLKEDSLRRLCHSCKTSSREGSNKQGATLMRLETESRAGEVEAIRPALKPFFPTMPAISAPGTVDSGEVCTERDHPAPVRWLLLHDHLPTPATAASLSV